MFTVVKMHETTRRLYTALEEMLGLKDVGSTLAAKTLGLSSAQTLNNWEERGVSKAGMVKASSMCGIRTAWIEREELPMFEPTRMNTPAQPDPLSNRVAEPDNSLAFGVPISSALDTIEKFLVRLDMSGRERIAPLFESFARSPGAVIKKDIAMLLENPEDIKRFNTRETSGLQKTG